VRICERNNYAESKVSEKGQAEDTPGTGEEIPLQHVAKTIMIQIVPLQPMEVHNAADICPVAL